MDRNDIDLYFGYWMQLQISPVLEYVTVCLWHGSIVYWIELQQKNGKFH